MPERWKGKGTPGKGNRVCKHTEAENVAQCSHHYVIDLGEFK